MSLRLVYSPAALADLDQIWRYSAESWGEERADIYLAAIRDTLLLLSHNPGLARNAGDIRPGLMKYGAGSHVLYFRVRADAIVVTRILHSRMDAGRHL